MNAWQVHRPCNSRSQTRGFALLITLTLLGFLVLLTVGLSGYARLESALTGNTLHQAQARQHALLALRVAVAQLQRHAGPDQRVTAAAGRLENSSGTARYTGVWDSTAGGITPRTWLVSGNESDFLAVAPDSPALASVELLGRRSSGVARDVVAPLVDLAAGGVPGQPGAAVIGRYAWWIGDEAIKASVTVPEDARQVTYPPFESDEQRRRHRQQIGGGIKSADFEPRADRNAPLIGNVVTRAQLAYLHRPDDTALGLDLLRTHYHHWTPRSLGVLASTGRGGLRHDLSLAPGALGPAFAAWADFKAATEDYAGPPAADTPMIMPAYGPDPAAPDPQRRRHRISPPPTPEGAGVAPVLTYFYLLVGVRKPTAAAPYSVSLRWAAALWNPYTSALVPEDLRLEISGLPTQLEFINDATQMVTGSISLRAEYGDPLRVRLPWTPAAPAVPSRQSWLPGRVYNWVHPAAAAPVTSGDNPGRFHSRELGGFADGLLVTVPGTPAVNGNTPFALRLPATTTLTVRLRRARDGALLATYTSPEYAAVPTTAPFPASNVRSQLGFLFRRRESFDSPAQPDTWLTTPGHDPRNPFLPATALLALPNGPNPAAYANYTTISAPDRFFDRDITRGTSYNEDVPLFELPRAPLLSLGELQHFPIGGARPFAIGNPWGSSVPLDGAPANAVFDDYFFSGLAGVDGSALGDADPLPNPRLVRLPRPSDGAIASPIEVTAAAGNSARHLLHAGAFNLNSTSSVAWAAVLRIGRFAPPDAFSYHDVDAATGTAGDGARRWLEPGAAHFFRFPQSAHEVFKAETAYAQSTTSTTGTGPVINTALFRRGLRTLDASAVDALAAAIANNIAARHAAAGPFRTLEEFLAPADIYGGRSALEKAIADAGLNSGVPEFSSQWLTSADIMTTLAASLFVRSDTFVVRAYGEAVNPATRRTEARAWCEATVQRVPGYFDSSQSEETLPAALNALNQRHGRRFRVVSFRWLTRYDI